MLATIAIGAKVLVTGAFGLSFDAPVEPAHLGAEVRSVELPFSTDSLADTVIEVPAGTRSPWRLLQPSQAPGVLAQLQTDYHVLLDEERRPIRLTATAKPNSSCTALAATLVPLLQRRYQLPASEASVPAHFGDETGALSVLCLDSGELLLDYYNERAVRAWLHRHRLRVRDFRKAAALRFADTFLQGSPSKLDGALGVPFRQPFPAGSFTPDERFERRLPSLPLPLDGARTYLVLAPDGQPVSVHATLEDPPATLVEQLRSALSAKYPVLIKDTPRHRIHSAGADWAVIRRHSSGEVELSFIDRRAHMQQRQRANAAKRAREAAQRAEEAAQAAAEEQAFEEAVRGL